MIAAVGVAAMLLLAPAAAQHAQHLPYFDTNLIVMEAENFTLSSGDEVGARAPSGWEAREWLHSANRFAASVADTYLSRSMIPPLTVIPWRCAAFAIIAAPPAYSAASSGTRSCHLAKCWTL